MLRSLESLGLFTVLLAPFAAGAVQLNTWVPLCWLWILLGVLTWRTRTGGQDFPRLTPSVVLIAHLLIAVQVVPLPMGLLKAVSPGSFAAHFVPPSARSPFAPMTASPIGTYQAWLYLAGLQGLWVTLFWRNAQERKRQSARLFLGMTIVGSVLGVEGLLQAGSAHPFWLYGLFPVPGADAHERGIFGPYYNRDHYSNLMAIAGSVAAGLLGNRLLNGRRLSAGGFLASSDFYPKVALAASLCFILVASAASGSRGGLVALGAGLAIGLGPTFLGRPRLALGFAATAALVLFGAGVPSAFARMADIDFENSRLLVWTDTLRLIRFFPLFGCGFGAFAIAYWPYQRVVRFEYWPHAHNEYLQWLIEGGLLGAALALFAAKRILDAAPRLVRDSSLRPALAGIVAAAVHALVDCGFRIPANAAWVALLAYLVYSESSRERYAAPYPAA